MSIHSEKAKRNRELELADRLEILPPPPDSALKIFRMIEQNNSCAEDMAALFKSEFFLNTFSGLNIMHRDNFLRHSIACSACSAMIADRICPELKAVAIAGGLLHDAGKLVIQECFPDEFQKIWSIHTEQDMPWLKAEQDILGIDHTVAGKMLAEKWSLPAIVSEIIELHHRSLNEIKATDFLKSREIILSVKLADILAHEITADTMSSHMPPDGYGDILSFFDINPEELEKIFRSLGKQYCDFAYMFDIKETELSFYYQSLIRAKDKLAGTAAGNSEGKKTGTEATLIEQKHKLVGAIAGGMAHDFNNILTAISGNVSLAKMYLMKDTEKTLEKLSQSEDACRRAKDLTRQLLIFSKKGGTPLKRPIAVSEIIKYSIGSSLRDSAVRCDVSVPDDTFMIDADKEQITQVINHLIKNAEEAMEQGGIITLKAENIPRGSAGKLPLRNTEYVKITVEDHGTGIAEKDLPRIFDPYFTTKNKSKGLGLAIAYSIISNHDGCIDLESELDAGTTFHLYLPACREVKQSTQPARE